MSEEKWLVKSSGRVLGPITLEDLIQGLRAKNIALIDEVKDPFNRWGFVREHPLLREIVRSLRAAELGENELTQSVLFNSKTTTQTVSEMDSSHQGKDFENSNVNETVAPTRSVEGRERRVNSGAFSKSATFGASYDPLLQKRIEQRKTFFKLGVGLLTVAALGIAFVFYLFRLEEHKSLRLADSRTLKQAEQAAEMGQYREATNLLSKFEWNRLTAEQKLFMIQVKLKVGVSSPEVFKMQEVSNERNWEITKALTHLKEGKYADAILILNGLLTQNPNDEIHPL